MILREKIKKRGKKISQERRINLFPSRARSILTEDGCSSIRAGGLHISDINSTVIFGRKRRGLNRSRPSDIATRREIERSSHGEKSSRRLPVLIRVFHLRTREIEHPRTVIYFLTLYHTPGFCVPVDAAENPPVLYFFSSDGDREGKNEIRATRIFHIPFSNPLSRSSSISHLFATLVLPCGFFSYFCMRDLIIQERRVLYKCVG